MPPRLNQCAFIGATSEEVVVLVAAVVAVASVTWWSRSLSALSQATPRLAEQFPTHAAFSTASVSEVFQRLNVRPSEAQASTLASMVFFNRGDHFDAVPLPPEAQ